MISDDRGIRGSGDRDIGISGDRGIGESGERVARGMYFAYAHILNLNSEIRVWVEWINIE